MFNMICLLFLFQVLVLFINCNIRENRSSKIKLLACIGIARARFEYDKDYINQLGFKLPLGKGTHNSYLDSRRILSLGLVNCYPKITSDQAQSLLNLINKKTKIDPFFKDNYNLLGFEDIENGIIPIDHNDKIKEMNELLSEIESDHVLLKEEEIKNTETNDNNNDNTNDKNDLLNDNQSNIFIQSFNNVIRIFALSGIDSYCGLFILILISFFSIRKLMQVNPKQNRNKLRSTDNRNKNK